MERENSCFNIFFVSSGDKYGERKKRLLEFLQQYHNFKAGMREAKIWLYITVFKFFKLHN